MSISDSRLSFLDCYKILDDALEAKGGVRVHVTDRNAAIHLRMRIHQARKLQRKENKLIYSEGDPQYGGNAYDGLVVRIKIVDEKAWVYVEKQGAAILKIETLNGATQIEQMPVHQQLEPP